MYVLLFGASANAMATHAVDRLPQTATEGRLSGAAERYSLSFSCGLTEKWCMCGEAAATAELLRLLYAQPRFECVHTIPALRPAPGEVRL
jgi:hypothetical protein